MFRVPLIIGTIYNIIAEAKQNLHCRKGAIFPGNGELAPVHRRHSLPFPNISTTLKCHYCPIFSFQSSHYFPNK
jgi:hypothetical protein